MSHHWDQYDHTTPRPQDIAILQSRKRYARQKLYPRPSVYCLPCVGLTTRRMGKHLPFKDHGDGPQTRLNLPIARISGSLII